MFFCFLLVETRISRTHSLARSLARSPILSAACIHRHFSRIQCAGLSLYAYALTSSHSINCTGKCMNESHATKHWSQLTNIIRYDGFFFLFSSACFNINSYNLNFQCTFFLSSFAFNFQFIRMCLWKIIGKILICFMNERELSSWLNQYKSCECVTMVLALCRHESLTKIMVPRVNVILSRQEKKSQPRTNIGTDGSWMSLIQHKYHTQILYFCNHLCP